MALPNNNTKPEQTQLPSIIGPKSGYRDELWQNTKHFIEKWCFTSMTLCVLVDISSVCE